MPMPSESRIALRAMEPDDVDFMYHCENAPDVSTESSLLAPISRHTLMQLVNASFLPITESGQIRLIVTLIPAQRPVGIVDLFAINLISRTASVGLAIYPKELRNQGYGHSALLLLEEYARARLNIRMLYAEIRASNQASTNLFIALGYMRIGTKFAWLKSNEDDGGWEDAICFQKIIARQRATLSH